MDRRLPLIVVVCVAIGAACTGAPEPSVNLAANDERNDDVLVLGTADGPMLVDAATGEPLGDGAATLTAPDGSRLYTSTVDGAATSLVTHDAQTGEVVARTRVDGRFDVRVASVSGEVVAMMEPLPAGADPWTPIPRATTTIVVVDPSGERPDRHLTLDGNVEPEAFSADDRNLFLIQHLPAEAPSAYRVTFLDLESGRIQPVRGRFKVPPQRMPGTRLLQTFDPAKAQLYTLYTNEATAADEAWDGGGGDGNGTYGNDGAYGHDADPGDVTFVHVLNLRNGWAFCAGVPRSSWGQPPRALAMATSPDGSILYLVDAIAGTIAEMDTRSLEIVRTHDVDLGSSGGVRTSAAVSADGRVLYVGSAVDGEAIHALATDTFAAVGRWEVGADVHDLEVATDGERLYAALDAAIALLDPDDGSTQGAVPIGGVEDLLHVWSRS